MSLAPPEFRSIGEYGESLGSVERWGSYVGAVLGRHGLDGQDLESGFVGTYPTFLAGDVVVKIFGYFRSWREDHAVELGMHELLVDDADIPAPQLVAHGELFTHDAEPWPYFVAQRLGGAALREQTTDLADWVAVAGQLGEVIRRVHELQPPEWLLDRPDWPADERAGCAARHRAWGSLPGHLVEQIDDFLLPPDRARTLIHADLTGDHVFVRDAELVGIIDWGDAMASDPHYELVALALDAFRQDATLLDAFLDAYGWPRDDEFAARALSAALLHRFNAFEGIADLDRSPTLDDLALRLFGKS